MYRQNNHYHPPYHLLTSTSGRRCATLVKLGTQRFRPSCQNLCLSTDTSKRKLPTSLNTEAMPMPMMSRVITILFPSPSSSVMGSRRFFFQLLYSFAFLTLVVLADHSSSTGQKKLGAGPVINVTKHLSFPDFSSNNPRIHYDLKLLGSANFSSEKGSVQIPDASRTADLRHQAGRAIYSFPIRLLDPLTQIPASFHTTFSFQFDNVVLSDPGENNGGSGLTFIIVPDEFTVGRPGPWLAMLNDACDDDYKAVAVEFDTRRNPEFGDPNDNHIGINLGSIISATTINASDVGVSLKDGSVHRAWITYDGLRKWMEVRLAPDGGEYPFQPIFSGPLDLSPFLNEYMFVGFSASTGNMTQIHNVHSWNFTSTTQAFLRVPSKESCESKIIIDARESTQRSNREAPSSFMIFVALVVLCLAVLLNLYYSGKRRDEKSTVVVLPEKRQRPRPPNKPRRFTISEISSATRCFNELQVLGSDSRGVFYRGTLPNGCQVAVKRFSAQFVNSHGLDRRRMLKEIGGLSRVRHPNLVPIRGWCHDKRETMVVYDYVPNGSLDKWLFGVGVLPWTRRLKVVKGVAEALSFLHSKQLAHKNLKTSSVFLDVSFRAVLGDFGFESAIGQKADVFSFGVFALEVIAGRRRMESEEEDLLEYAGRMHERAEQARVVDGRMGCVVNLEQAVRVVEVALLCTLNETKSRPSMDQVVGFLAMETPMPKLPPSQAPALFPCSRTTNICRGYSCSPFK